MYHCELKSTLLFWFNINLNSQTFWIPSSLSSGFHFPHIQLSQFTLSRRNVFLSRVWLQNSLVDDFFFSVTRPYSKNEWKLKYRAFWSWSYSGCVQQRRAKRLWQLLVVKSSSCCHRKSPTILGCVIFVYPISRMFFRQSDFWLF